jgi:hypothetical protein
VVMKSSVLWNTMPYSQVKTNGLVASSFIGTPWPLGRKRTIPTERPPLVGEVSVNFCGYRVSRGQRNGSRRPLKSVF